MQKNPGTIWFSCNIELIIVCSCSSYSYSWSYSDYPKVSLRIWLWMLFFGNMKETRLQCFSSMLKYPRTFGSKKGKASEFHNDRQSIERNTLRVGWNASRIEKSEDCQGKEKYIQCSSSQRKWSACPPCAKLCKLVFFLIRSRPSRQDFWAVQQIICSKRGVIETNPHHHLIQTLGTWNQSVSRSSWFSRILD